MSDARKTVVLVEDDPRLQRQIVEILAKPGDIECLYAVSSAEEALKLIPENPPEVILMDINLPGISGFGALEILRHDPATAHIPVMALSANAIPRDIRRGLEAGFFRYLTKPIKVNEFMDALDVSLQFASDKASATNETAE